MRRILIRTTRRIQPVLLVLLMPLLFIPMVVFYLVAHMRAPVVAPDGALSGYELQYPASSSAAAGKSGRDNSSDRCRVVVACRWS